MEYKTPFIAKKLGVSTKAVVRIAQQLNLNIEKNKNGHYVFTQEDLDQMLKFHLSHAEYTSASSSQISSAKISSEFEQFTEQFHTITKRLDRMEEKIQEKADDVVNYQLLQHRKEMEEMEERIRQLEATLEKKEALYITPDSLPTNERKEKPKRRKMILSMLGL